MGHLGKFITFIFLLLTLSLAASAHAAQFIVTRSDDPTPGPCAVNDCSLREAVIASNGNDQDDNIVLEATSYLLTRQGSDDAADVGDLDLNDPENTLNISGVNSETTIIDAADLDDRIFEIVGFSMTINLTDVTLQNGNAGSQEGGAIKFGLNGGSLSTLNIVDSQLIGNHASLGGAIYGCCGSGGPDPLGSINLLRSRLFDNSASEDGGAVNHLNSIRLTVQDSTIDMNNADGSGGGIQGNSTAPSFMSNSTISNNTAGGSGGGLHYKNSTEEFSINNSTISGNQATTGGAIALEGLISLLKLRNTTITENQSSGQGAGLYYAPNGGLTDGTIANSILTANSSNSSSSSPDCFFETNVSHAGFISLGYNIFGDVSDCDLSGPGDLPGINDPGLGPLANNGGPTPTHGNLEGSPAIDAGDPSGCLDSDGVEFTTDQRGEPRPLNGRCDIGAFEGIFVPPSPVPTESPGGGGAETGSGGCAMDGSASVNMTGFWALLVLLSLGWGARRGMR